MSFRNAILFFAIFAIFAAGTVAYRVIRPGKTISTATTTAVDTSLSKDQKKDNNSGKGWSLFSPVNIFSRGPQFVFPKPEPINYYNKSDGETTRTPEEIEAEIRDISRKTERVKRSADELTKQLEAQKEASEFKGKIILEQIYGFYSDKPSDEIMVMRAPAENREKIAITNWKLMSVPTGNSVTIGNGVYLPYPGTVMPEESIFLSPGDVAYIISGRSPTGVSFRLNKCTGYFGQFQRFTPSLPRRCTPLHKETLPAPPNNLDDKCLDYLDSLSACRVPDQTFRIDLKPECVKFVSDRANYNWCVSAHRSDGDFYKDRYGGKEWRVYLRRDDRLWKDRREIIKLLDTKGKTVAMISY